MFQPEIAVKLAPERMVDVAWGKQADAVYPVELLVLAQDRPGLLRDVSEVYAREKLNVVGVNSSSANGEARMLFTIEIEVPPTLTASWPQCVK